jgi:RecA/RadA recombinase/intein/homing endonuclease
MTDFAKLAAALEKAAGGNDETQGPIALLDSGFAPLNYAISGRWDGGFPSGRIVELFGPESSGKCLTAGTYLLGEHGLATIEELWGLRGFTASSRQHEEPVVHHLLNELGELEPTSHFVWNGRRRFLRLVTRSGRVLEATARHPVRVMNERGRIVWRHAEKVRVGDHLPTLRGQKLGGSGTLETDEARMLGYLVADGYYGDTGRFSLSNSDPEIVNDCRALLRRYLGVDPKSTPPREDSASVEHWVYSVELRRILHDRYGLRPVLSKDKIVPLAVRVASIEAQRAFIRAYVECEAAINPGTCIEVCSASHELLRQIQLMLLNLGVYATVHDKPVAGREHVYRRLAISGADYDRYGQEIGFGTTARQAQFRSRSVAMERTYSDCIPNLGGILRDLFEASDTDREASSLLEGYMGEGATAIGRDRLQRVIAYFGGRPNAFNVGLVAYLRQLAALNYAYDEVVAVEEGDAPTFDVAMPGTHSFWSNGFISHNTWLATQAMIAAQRVGGVAGFHDHERSFVSAVAERLGLDLTPGRFFFKTPESYEQSVVHFIKATTAVREAKVLDPKTPLCWVFDSLASMVPQQRIAKDATELNMNDTTALARLTSTTFPSIAQIAEKNNVLVLVLNQIRLKPGVVYGDPTTTPGGNAPKYYASVRIQLAASRLMKDEGGEKVMIGQEVTARCVKNKIARPFVTAKWRFLFGEDGVGRFDVAGSLLEFALAKKLLKTSGSRVEWIDGKTYFKGQLAQKIETEGCLGELQALIAQSGETPDVAPPESEE